jgi:hypothetical protein
MKIVDEIKERVAAVDNGKQRYSPFVTLYNKATGAKKTFPAIDAANAVEMPNAKWSKTPVLPVVEETLVIAPVVAEVEETKAPEPMPELESVSVQPARRRKISLDSQE